MKTSTKSQSSHRPSPRTPVSPLRPGGSGCIHRSVSEPQWRVRAGSSRYRIQDIRADPSPSDGPWPGVSGGGEAASTILIVESNGDRQRHLCAGLVNEYRILSEYNGDDGLSTALREVPDLIITDVVVPGMDGIEMCKRIRQDGRTCHIPVIFFTSRSRDQDRVAGLSSGADAYFSKPVSISVLKAQIGSIIANRLALQARLADQRPATEAKPGRTGLDRCFSNSVVRSIEAHLGDTKFNPERLAEHLGISPRQLYRKLNETSGSTVSEFINRIRMEKAGELLGDWQLNISEIAVRVGFTEASNFSRAFRKYYGSSPSHYRNKL